MPKRLTPYQGRARSLVPQPIDPDTDRCSVCGGEEVWSEVRSPARYECDFCGVPTRGTYCAGCGEWMQMYPLGEDEENNVAEVVDVRTQRSAMMHADPCYLNQSGPRATYELA